MPPTALIGIEHLLCGHAVAGQGLVIDVDSEHRQPGDLLGRRVGRAGDGLDDLFDLLSLGFERLQVVAVELDAKVGPDARDHLVDPHLDRLGVDGPHAGKDFRSPGPSRRPAPPASLPASTLERGFRVMKMSDSSSPIGSVATSALPVLRPDVLDLVGKLPLEDTLDVRAVAKRFLQADAGQPDGVDDQSALIQAGDELRPKPQAEDRRRRPSGQRPGRALTSGCLNPQRRSG